MLSHSIQSRVLREFAESEQAQAIAELKSIKLQHMMAESQTNLDNTWLAILQLSKGNLNELQNLVKHAKQDFRDVIYWATLSK